jgi:hypothetical protein
VIRVISGAAAVAARGAADAAGDAGAVDVVITGAAIICGVPSGQQAPGNGGRLCERISKQREGSSSDVRGGL